MSSDTIRGLKEALKAARQEKCLIAAFLHDGQYDQWIPNPYGIPLAVIRHAFRKNCHAQETRKNNVQTFSLAAAKSQWEQYWLQCAILYSEMEKYEQSDDYYYRPESTSVIAMVKKGYVPLSINGNPIDPDNLETPWASCPTIAAIVGTWN